MPMSTYAADKTLDFWVRGVAMTAPTRVYVSLHTDDPGNNGANEVSLAAWPAYTREDPANGGAVADGFDAASGKATENAIQMLFPRHDGAAPVTITDVTIWDAPTGGNPIISGGLVDAEGDPTTKTINPGDECVIYVDELDFSVI